VPQATYISPVDQFTGGFDVAGIEQCEHPPKNVAGHNNGI